MRHVTVNFVRFDAAGRGEAGLRRATCLVENAAHLRRRGLARDATLEIVLLGDVDALAPATLEALAAAPCRVHRAQPVYDRLIARFPRLLGRAGGPYATFGFGFLRWLVIAELFAGEPVLCYDGDIIHNVPLGDLGRACAGLTTTATSTCFAAISDPAWFAAWEAALTALDADADGFMRGRGAPLAAAGCDIRRSPEEMLAKLLIEDGTLRQDPLPADFPYWIVPQPHFLPRLYAFVRTRGAPAAVPAPMRYARTTQGVDTLNGRPVAFWHLQKPFLNQLSCLLAFRELRPDLHPGRVPPLSFYGRPADAARVRPLDPYHDEGGFPVPDAALAPLAARMIAGEERNWRTGIAPIDNPFAAAAVYAYYFRRHDLGLLFDAATWPVPGMWA
ncbi:MAG: hypothetical protein IT561_04885 [Alphaproteobacteria bacterium]|nr:hypothetical protein [Alphaproteobacteria bacterium]